jgi:hypothetical protein
LAAGEILPTWRCLPRKSGVAKIGLTKVRAFHPCARQTRAAQLLAGQLLAREVAL